MRIAVREPFPWVEMVDYLSTRRTPELETFEAGRYARQTDAGLVTVVRKGVALHVDGPAERARVARMFDVERDFNDVQRTLGPAARWRVPGCWEPFELCVRVVLGQQVSVAGAHTLMGRLNRLCPLFTPEQVVNCDLAGIGLTRQREATVRAVAAAAAAGQLRLGAQPWDESADRLLAIPGIGPWTVTYLRMRVGRDPDAFPHTDLGLLRAMGTRDAKELLRASEHWRPYRAYAAMTLWMSPQEADSLPKQPAVG
jgi:3-methyladenine DNA glycosylase/8-oxoguanine DNA glycosylase